MDRGAMVLLLLLLLLLLLRLLLLLLLRSISVWLLALIARMRVLW